MSYKYDLPDFKRYLNDLNAKYRIDGLIFWQNRIPLPIDLFNRMFRESDYFISLYFDHLFASIMILNEGDELLEKLELSFEELPTNDVNKEIESLRSLFRLSLQKDRVLQNLAKNLSDLMGIKEYELDSHKLISAISHKGKKYPRLYAPNSIKEVITGAFPSAFDHIGISNTDMIGNVIADHYDMYRAGFGDALAIIFNKLLDFRILCNGLGGGLQTVSLNVTDSEAIIIEERTSDGSLWEADIVTDHVLRLNPEHPFYEILGRNSDDLQQPAIDLLYALSKYESEQFSTSQKKLIENMRQEISRDLWIKYQS